MPWTHMNDGFGKNNGRGSFVPATGCGSSGLASHRRHHYDRNTVEKEPKKGEPTWEEVQQFLAQENEEHRRKMRGAP